MWTQKRPHRSLQKNQKKKNNNKKKTQQTTNSTQQKTVCSISQIDGKWENY